MHALALFLEDGVRLDIVGEKELFGVGVLRGTGEANVLPEIAAVLLNGVVEERGAALVTGVVADPVSAAGGTGLDGGAADDPDPLPVLVLGDEHGGKDGIGALGDAPDLGDAPSEAHDADVGGFEDGQALGRVFLVVAVVDAVVAAGALGAADEEVVEPEELFHALVEGSRLQPVGDAVDVVDVGADGIPVEGFEVGFGSDLGEGFDERRLLGA